VHRRAAEEECNLPRSTDARDLRCCDCLRSYLVCTDAPFTQRRLHHTKPCADFRGRNTPIVGASRQRIVEVC
jgi:hypothetical protein